VEIVETDVNGMIVIQPWTPDMMVQGSREILAVLDAEIKRRGSKLMNEDSPTGDDHNEEQTIRN
jgi:hypothetical protein